MNKVSGKIQVELDELRKTIKELKIEENIFNGLSSELYMLQREVDDLKYILMKINSIISELIGLNLNTNKKLEDVKDNLSIYLKKYRLDDI